MNAYGVHAAESSLENLLAQLPLDLLKPRTDLKGSGTSVPAILPAPMTVQAGSRRIRALDTP
jgi:hypothetical protein